MRLEKAKKKSIWENICECVYKGILDTIGKSEEVVNTGVEMIRFQSDKSNDNNKESNEKNESKQERIIQVSKLMRRYSG